MKRAPVRIQPATTPEQFKRIEQLADTIWREHYIPIIGKPQVDYMLGRFQSEGAIARQVSEGMRYYLLCWQEHPAGYFAYAKKGSDLFLSKIYVEKTFRGRGLAREAMAHIREAAGRERCSRITLTVNKDNAGSISAYQRMGFRKGPGTITDIGDGFIMDDYLMVLELGV